MPTVKTAVSLPKSVFDQTEEEARELKVSRSRIFVIALEEYFRQRRRQRLLDQINATCGDAPDEEEMAFLRRANALTAERLKREDEASVSPPW